MVKKYLTNNEPAKIVTAFNVYAHADDLQTMTKAIKMVLSEDGIFVFEVSYLLDLVKKLLIGTIFHEHLSYHSVLSLERFLDAQDLELIQVTKANEQGGSLIGYVQHKGGPFSQNNSISNFKTQEKKLGLTSLDVYKNMQINLESIKKKINKLFKNIYREGKTICAYGAARSGTTILSYFDIGSQITFIVDDNENKHHKYSPGFGIPVLPVSSIYEKKPYYIVILAWMHSETIIRNNIDFMVQGGKFINIHPVFEIIDINSKRY